MWAFRFRRAEAISAASGFSRARRFAQYQKRRGRKPRECDCQQKGCPDRAQQAGKSKPNTDQQENSGDHEQQRRGHPCRHCPLELPRPMLQVNLDAFQPLFNPVLGRFQSLVKLPGRPMNQGADPEPQPAWFHAQGRFSPIISKTSPPWPCRMALREYMAMP
jgi:hypothetical protein